MGAHLAGGLTPLLVTALLAHFYWRRCSSFLARWDLSGQPPGIAGFVMTQHSTLL